MICILFLVSNLTFFNVCIFHDILLLNVYLKNRLLTPCFQQSAKCKMTSQTIRKHHAFSQTSTLYLDLPLTPRFSPPPPLSFLCLIDSFQRVPFQYTQQIEQVEQIQQSEQIEQIEQTKTPKHQTTKPSKLKGKCRQVLWSINWYDYLGFSKVFYQFYV